MRVWRMVLIAFVIIAIGSAAVSAPPPSTPTVEWPGDTIKLKSGTTYRGLLIENGPQILRFQIVRRSPGRPTFWITMVFNRTDVERIDVAGEAERALLKAKLAELEPTTELRRMEQLDLVRIPWAGKADAGLQYQSDYFLLVSDAPEEVVRRAAVRLEQVYTAFTRYLPPRFPGGNPTRISVHQSLEDYQKSVPGMDTAFRNPAYFNPSANRIHCGTDLLRIGQDLEKFRRDAAAHLAELKAQEVQLVRLFGKRPELDRHLAPINEARTRIKDAAKRNEAVFDRASNQLFRLLAHEAFHAYAGNFIFRPTQGKEGSAGMLPRWLNEGMAQVFESAIYEAGELRVGHADPKRLEKAQDLLSRKEFPTIAEIVGADVKTFTVTHAGMRPESDRIYVGAWALTSYLMFDRRVTESAKFGEFLEKGAGRRDAVAALEGLADRPLKDFESAFHQWLRRLRPDGTLWEWSNGK